MTQRFHVRLGACITAAALSAALFFATGCKSDNQKALDQAKSQAATTQTPQEVQYIDSNGNTVTTVVQPPISGQAEQVSTTTTPPPPGPKPHWTTPIVTPLGPNGAPIAPAANQAAYNGNTPQPQPAAAAPPPNGYPAQAANAGPAPAYNLTVPAGTELAVRVNQRIDVKHAVAGEHFSGEIVEPVTRDGGVLIPRGTPSADASTRRITAVTSAGAPSSSCGSSRCGSTATTTRSTRMTPFARRKAKGSAALD
jgi:hypothetical protein